MLVRATQMGFFGHKRIREGQTFRITELKVTKIDPKTKQEKVETITVKDQFEPSWMEEVDEKEVKRSKTPVVKFEQNDNVEAVI